MSGGTGGAQGGEGWGRPRNGSAWQGRVGYNINIMQQSACLVFNPITVNNFASVFDCTPVGRASDSMMAPT